MNINTETQAAKHHLSKDIRKSKHERTKLSTFVSSLHNFLFKCLRTQEN